MATLGFEVLLLHALEQVISNKPTGKMSYVQLLWLYSIMLTATCVKLALWLCCRTSRNNIDHYFDVVTNIVGLVAAVLGKNFFWWIDPVGAIVLAIYTISNWCGTVTENADVYSTIHTSFLGMGGIGMYMLKPGETEKKLCVEAAGQSPAWSQPGEPQCIKHHWTFKRLTLNCRKICL